MVKVLYIDHPESDYQSALVYLGLCQELGADNVVDWPRKPSFHGEVDTSYFLSDGTRGRTEPHVWFQAQHTRQWTDGEVYRAVDADEFALIVLASPRTMNAEALRRLVRVVGSKGTMPIVIIDGEDYDCIRWDLIEEFDPHVYFKREMISNPQVIYPAQRDRVRAAHREPSIMPLPFSSPIAETPRPVAKDIDVSFLAAMNVQERQKCADALTDAFGARAYTNSTRLSYAEYIDVLNRSRISVSVRGFGWDTMRYWEILSMPGTFLLSDRSPLAVPKPFLSGVHCDVFGSPEELVALARKYLDNEIWRSAMARVGHEHLREHHTPAARARYILANAL